LIVVTLAGKTARAAARLRQIADAAFSSSGSSDWLITGLIAHALQQQSWLS